MSVRATLNLSPQKTRKYTLAMSIAKIFSFCCWLK
jgi:hypothetical protein